jgi:hypothetical protein
VNKVGYVQRAAWFAIVLLAATALGAPRGQKDGPGVTEDEVDSWVRHGRTAAAAGDHERARRFLLRALSLRPRSTEILADLAGLTTDDAEATALWAHLAAERSAGGKLVLDGKWPDVTQDDVAAAREIARVRSRALGAVMRTLSRLSGPDGGALARYLATLGRALRPVDPAEIGALESAVTAANERCAPDKNAVIRELRDLARSALSTDRLDVALAAARILIGLHQQKDRTPDAEVGNSDAVARKVIREVRRRMREGEETVHTVETLSAMSRDEAKAFSEAHATWDSPGIAVSPGGLYRIETTCGHQTLLAVATEVEYQHRRVAKWFGTDPFKGRPGLVRLCRSRPDFEREGTPFWWAGGFQSGDLTVIIVNFTNSTSVARTITHELTHRFDGSIHRGLTTWLLEGRAVYAENCTPTARSPALDEKLLDLGRIVRTHQMAYGKLKRLEKLLRGAVDDYRDNYSAGYALWTFLSRFTRFDDGPEREKPLFAARIPGYLASFTGKRGKDPIRRFVAAFADGKDGRPDSLEAFADVFTRFLAEAAQEKSPEWKIAWIDAARAARRRAGRSRSRTILDAATWPRSRRRFDAPTHGEGQAGAAGRLLAKSGRLAAARAAFEWSFSVDEPDASLLALAADLHEKGGSSATAWALRMAAARAAPSRFAPPESHPVSTLVAPCRAVLALVKRYADLEATGRESKRTRLARVLASRHDRLQEALGRPVDRPDAGVPEAAIPGSPDCPPYRSVLDGGLEGDSWLPGRCGPKGPWHLAGPGRLELGRAKPGPAVSGRIRDAGIRRVFVRGREFHQGTYTLRTRIRFVSACVSTFVVLGQTRYDRGLQITFAANDWAFYHGRTSEAAPLAGVRVGISDLRPFDAATAHLAAAARIDRPKDQFEVVIHVSGALVRVFVEGRLVMSHRRTTGNPVEGRIGFGLGRGIAVYEDPEVRRHDTLAAGRICPCGRFDEVIGLEEIVAFPLSTCLGRRTIGIPVGPHGTVLLWYGDRKALGSAARDILIADVDRVRRIFDMEDLPIDICVAYPPLEQEGPKLPTAKDLDLPEARVLRHRGSRGLTSAEGPSWFMLDDFGVIRGCGPGFVREPAFSLVHRLFGW